MKTLALAGFLALLLAAAAVAAPEGWHDSMKDGLAAAKRSGKPLFVVTIWPPDV